jgi:hypothetical protein
MYGITRILLPVVALLLPLHASAGKIGIGFLAPDLPVGPYERFGLVQRLASHVGHAIGARAQGFAYRSNGDLRRDVRAKKVQFAVIGGFRLATRRSFRIIGNARLAKRVAVRWSLMARRKTSVGALRGKVLQLPAIGNIVYGLVENGLLGGQLKVRKHFKIRMSPGLTSAQEAVRLKNAEVTFAPINTRGLVPLVQRSIPAPAPALVQLDTTIPRATVMKVVQALQSFRDPTGTIVGWTGADAAIYDKIARLARKQPVRMVLLPAEGLRLRSRGLIQMDPSHDLELLPLDHLYQLP